MKELCPLCGDTLISTVIPRYNPDLYCPTRMSNASIDAGLYGTHFRRLSHVDGKNYVYAVYVGPFYIIYTTFGDIDVEKDSTIIYEANDISYEGFLKVCERFRNLRLFI